MTEQELHEKLTDILQMKLQELPLKPLGIIYKEAAEYLADALIAEGMIFVDDKTVILPNRISGKTMIEKANLYEKMKHRAEVAERALDMCETAYILALNHRATEWISGQAIASDLGVHKFFIEQAEKELAEERK